MDSLNKSVAGGDECSPNADCLYKAELTGNPTPLVHQDMSKKTIFYGGK